MIRGPFGAVAGSVRVGPRIGRPCAGSRGVLRLSPSAATTPPTPPQAPRALPPVLGRLLRGTFWLALRSPLAALFAFWSVPLIIDHVGADTYNAYGFAWGFGFFQFLLEFGMSSALQRQISERWTNGDRAGVDRAIACGMSFYAAVAVVQAAALLAIAAFGIPDSFPPDQRRLIVRLLWLQAVTAGGYGLMTVVSGVLQAARRYDFIPRYELLIVVLRFAVLWAGLSAGVDYFLVVVAQTALTIGLSAGPALWVMARELGHVPHFRGATWEDYRGLVHISSYMFLIQLSVVLADKIDTTVLGYAMSQESDPIAVYQAISKPFLQIRQTGWMLAYLVMPAVASLAASGDRAGLERIKYDGSRLLVGVLTPVVLLAYLDARPFLSAWVPRFAGHAPLMRLFLVATLPLVLSVLVQTAIGLGKIRVIALAALAGSVVNLPLSYAWTRLTGDVSGVIWGTVLTTLFSNLLLPGIYCFRELEVSAPTFFRRTLGAPLAGAACLLLAAWSASGLVASDPPAGASRLARAVPLAIHVAIGVAAYAVGYLAVPPGRDDLAALARRLRRRPAG